MRRCDSCGFLDEEYSPHARTSLPRAMRRRLQLSYHGLPDGLAPMPHDEARERLGRALASGGLHEAHHLVSDVARATAAAAVASGGTGGTGGVGAGTIERINVSGGGVPKLAVPEAEVGWRGLVTDRHDDVKHHGHPGQGLCLWSLERIEALAREGHPIAPGSAGENLTMSGLDWDRIRPGLRFGAGEGGVVFQVTEPATPCTVNAGWFSGGDFLRMSHDRHPGWSRWYAAVLSPGTLKAGDPVSLVALA